MSSLSFGFAEKVFVEYLQGNGYNFKTIRSKKYTIELFLEYLKTNNIIDLREITINDVTGYSKYLDKAVSKKTGNHLCKRSKSEKLCVVKQFFKSLYVNELILNNPLSDFKIVSDGKDFQRHMFSKKEINHILDNIDTNERLGLRNRTVFELMYSSGLRVSEVSRLNADDIDFETGMMLVRNSKFNKDRIVPVTEIAIKFLKLYLRESKRLYKKDKALFTGQNGRLSPATLTSIFRKILKKQNKYKPHLSAHSIRHSTATHLLETGANLRYVQELLGHESIETTVMYTHMFYDNLKKVYKSFHARENEYYCEVDSEYMKRLNNLKSQVERCGMLNRKYGLRRKMWYARKRTK